MRTGRFGRLLCAGCCLAVLGAALPAEAGSRVRARRFFKQAQALFDKGEYDKAAVLYESAYREKPLPALLINIGQCYRKQNDCDKATSYYERYLAEDPKGAHREQVEELIKRCREEQASSKLVEEPAPAEAEQPAPPPPPPAPPPPEQPRKGLHPVWFWSAVGLTGATVLIGTITGAVALSKSDRYNDPTTPESELPGLKDSGKALKGTSTAMFVLAGTAAAGAAVLFFFTDFKRKGGGAEATQPAAALNATPLPGGGFVSLGGSF